MEDFEKIILATLKERGKSRVAYSRENIPAKKLPTNKRILILVKNILLVRLGEKNSCIDKVFQHPPPQKSNGSPRPRRVLYLTKLQEQNFLIVKLLALDFRII